MPIPLRADTVTTLCRLIQTSAGAARNQTLAALVAVFALVGEAQACNICVPFPAQTFADRIVEAEAVVLARENPDKPFSFIAVETLRGDLEALPIDHFLNSRTRRQLALQPDRGVVLVREDARADWHSLGFADVDMEFAVREIVFRGPQWKQAGVGAEQRLNFMAGYLGHANPDLHQLAYLEVGRARYDQIRHFSARWPLDQVREFLTSTRYYEWRPLAILTLAFHGEASDRDYIVRRYQALARGGPNRHLSAWATAYIEVEGEAALDSIDDQYLLAADRTPEEMTAIVAALSEHGNFGRAALRDRVVSSYGLLLEQHPQMASAVTTDLLRWQRWQLADQLTAVLENLEQPDPATEFAIRLYLARAKKESSG